MNTDELRRLVVLSHKAANITDEVGELLRERAESIPQLALVVLDQLQGELIEEVGDQAEMMMMALAHRRFQERGDYLIMPATRDERRLVREALTQMARRNAKHHPKASKHLRWLADRTLDLPPQEEDQPEQVYQLPPVTCPLCEMKSQAASLRHARRAPEPGDYTVCQNCASPLIFGPEMQPRAALKADIDQLPAEDRDALYWALRRARERDRSEETQA